MPKELTPDEAFQRARAMSERYVARGPYEFYPDPEIVEIVQRGLGENERKHGKRYCP